MNRKWKGLIASVAFATLALFAREIYADDIVISVPPLTEIIETTAGTYYSLDDGKSWSKRLSANFDVSSLLGTKEKTMRLDIDMDHSTFIKITLPARPVAPKTGGDIKADYTTGKLIVAAGLEYKTVGDIDWTKVTAPTELDISDWETGGSVLYRKSATATSVASVTATFKVAAKPVAPKLKLNTDSYIASPTIKMEYRVMPTLEWTRVTDADAKAKFIAFVIPDSTFTTPTNIQVRFLATAKTSASRIGMISIYPRAITPEMKEVNIGKGTVAFDGTTALEYKVDIMNDGMDVSATNIKNLTAENIKKAGKWAKATIKDGKITIDFNKLLSPTPMVLYVRTIAIAESIDKTTKATVPGKSASIPVTLGINGQPPALADSDVAIDYTARTFPFTDPTKYEWSLDGKTWTVFQNSSLTGEMVKGKTVSIRRIAEGTSPTGVIKKVKITS